MEEGGAKRSFGDLDDEEEDIFSSSKKAKVEETVPGGATGMILSLRDSLKTCEAELATCKTDLETANVEVQKWHSVFQLNSAITSGATPEPVSVNRYLQNLKSSEESLREQLEKAKKKEAAFIVSLAKRDQEISELKSTVRDLKAQLKPQSLQARRLLLDPAIHEEFTRLKNLVEEKDKKVKELEDNIAAVNFTPQSKMGKMLMAKCRTLQEENEEVGLLHSEGQIHELSMKLALQKSQNAALKTELEGLCRNMDGLTNNVEKSNELVLILQQKLAEKDSDLSKTKQEDISHTPSEEDELLVMNEIKVEETVIRSDIDIEVVNEINVEKL